MWESVVGFLGIGIHCQNRLRERALMQHHQGAQRHLTIRKEDLSLYHCGSLPASISIGDFLPPLLLWARGSGGDSVKLDQLL